ncbi:ATP-binding protein [Dyella choica]|uniref:histidine kinase n=1 Tax=Dyella choica TaxID=1927959 RepID=A0A3S0PKZ0_9GAMM|nr:ATP-binding protein [Dyella choica]RUL79044.1 transporter substrate-binding domain-containing protein [Dyella choica]
MRLQEVMRRLRLARILAFCAWALAGSAFADAQFVEGPRNAASYDLHIPLTAHERAYLAGLPTLRLGMDPNWAPYAFVNRKGQLDGISANYLQYIVQSLHIKVQRVDSPSWVDTVGMANNGQIEVLVAVSNTSQLTAAFVLTQAYINYPEVIVAKNGRRLEDIHDLDGLRVAQVDNGGTGPSPGLNTSIAFQRVLVKSVQDGLQLVARGQVDAFVGNLGVAQRLIRQSHAGVLYVSGATGYSRSLSFGLAPQYEPLRVLMDRVLKAIPEEERERVQNTWLPTSLEYGVPRRTLWEVLTPIGLVIFVSIIVLGLIIVYLRREIYRRRQAQQELQFQLRFLESMMATLPTPVFVKDLQGRYVMVNSAFQQIVGRQAKDLIGRTASEVHPMQTASNDRLEALTREVLSTGKLAHGELQYRSHSGDLHDVIYWLQMVREEKERPRAVLGILVDVSPLRAMERQQRALKRQLIELTDMLPAVLFQVRYVPGKGFLPVFINPYAETLTGFSQDELMSNSPRWLPSVSPSARWRLWRALLHARRHHTCVEQELVLAREDGSQVWVRLEAVCHQSTEEGCIYTGYLGDVTQLKLQAESLARAKQEAERAARVKDVFLATMSHEIRTPMSGVIGVLELMDRSRMHADDQHLLDMARGAAATLLRILNDVLDFSKSQSSRLTIEHSPFSLREVIDSVVGLFAPEMRRKGLRFDILVSSLVAAGHVGDGQRLAQVLLNLVGNALKFTDSGSIEVAVEALSVDPLTLTQRLTVAVRDTGVGIDEAEQARLFEPFVQAGVRHHGGTGLGLAICKRLVEAMGGSISLHSAVGKGTSMEVTLELPVDKSANGATEMSTDSDSRRSITHVASAASGSRQAWDVPAHSILLVEDQSLNLELLTRQLQALGVQAFDTADDGMQAWKAYEKHAYQLVITDCAMPEMDGETLIRHIRAREAGTARRVCLVALTANAMEPQQQACLDAGADTVLLKPMEIDRLRALLQQVFGAPELSTPPILPPASIPAEEWPWLRDRILTDLEQELDVAVRAMNGQDWRRAWNAVHRILGVARLFKLSGIVSLATAIQAQLEQQDTSKIVMKPLEEAISALTAATRSSH